MGIGTHIVQIIQKQQSNRSASKKAKRYYRSELTKKYKSGKQFNHDKFPEISEQEREKIKAEIRKKVKNEFLISIFKTAATFFVIIIIFCYLFRSSS